MVGRVLRPRTSPPAERLVASSSPTSVRQRPSACAQCCCQRSVGFGDGSVREIESSPRRASGSGTVDENASSRPCAPGPGEAIAPALALKGPPDASVRVGAAKGRQAVPARELCGIERAALDKPRVIRARPGAGRNEAPTWKIRASPRPAPERRLVPPAAAEGTPGTVRLPQSQPVWR